MLIIAHHNIQDSEKFWKEAKAITSNMPSHLKLHSVYPSTDLKTGTCVWEAPAVNDVQKFLDDNVGDVSKNYCYEVDEAAAFGLPKFKAEAIHN